ncbi:MAG: VacJ family lipoprotein [Desulfobacteraceae bacterium]|nr:VacJ family lipoprotein [Desulfobacteraceae bacterium]
MTYCMILHNTGKERLLEAVVFIFLFCFVFADTLYAGQTPDNTAAAGKQENVKGQAGQQQNDFDGFDSGGDFDDFDEFDSGTESRSGSVYDPLSGYNRFMTKVNDRIYFWVLKPAASGYAAVTPGFVRKSVNRFFKNLGYPVRFVNNVLQLKFRRAGVETARFLVNSTVGLAGLGDPADRWMDLEAYPEDFGQTLGVYGIGGGGHLVLPLLGPSNFRDSLARIPDLFLDPLYYLEPSEAAIGLRVFDRVNSTSLHLGEYESLKKDAVDWYIFLKNAYENRRKKKIEE